MFKKCFSVNFLEKLQADKRLPAVNTSISLASQQLLVMGGKKKGRKKKYLAHATKFSGNQENV